MPNPSPTPLSPGRPYSALLGPNRPQCMPNPSPTHSALTGPTRPYSALLGPTRPEPAPRGPWPILVAKAHFLE